MKVSSRLITQLFLVISFSILFLSTSLAEPINLSLAKRDIRAYHDSGCYEKEFTAVIEKARAYVNQQVLRNQAQKNRKKLAIVLDIDETSISNYAYIAKRDFITDPRLILQENTAANAPPLKPMLTFYKDALNRGVHIFFVSGRPTSQFTPTKRNLWRAGFHHWTALYLRPQNYHQASIIPFKSQARRLITEQGYTIIASIGDQNSDFKGGFTQKGFKLPNPFYYIP